MSEADSKADFEDNFEGIVTYDLFYDNAAEQAWRFTAALAKFQQQFANALERARRQIVARKSHQKALEMAAAEKRRLATLPKHSPQPTGWMRLLSEAASISGNLAKKVSAMVPSK